MVSTRADGATTAAAAAAADEANRRHCTCGNCCGTTLML